MRIAILMSSVYIGECLHTHKLDGDFVVFFGIIFVVSMVFDVCEFINRISRKK